MDARRTRPVRKAVLPVAGLGTRFLPFTKTVPKEMLPLVDVPAVQLIVEECAASGVREVIFVTSPSKSAIPEHFTRAPDLEARLAQAGKTLDLQSLRRLEGLATFSIVMQEKALGLGHAVLCARPLVGEEPFAVLLCDELLHARPPGLRQLLDVHAETGVGVVGLREVPAGHEHLYGIVAGAQQEGGHVAISSLVEKPERGHAPSRLAIIGRYVLPALIFDILEQTHPGRGGEIQLTDALATLRAREGLLGKMIDGRRFDVGDRAGYVLAFVHHALQRPDVGGTVRAELKRMLDES